MRLSLLLSLFLVVSAFAQLKWETTEQSVKAKPGDHEMVATYRFTNTGTTPITIDNNHTSCGCTTAPLAKNDYSPTQTRQIVARIVISNTTSHHHKSIIVTTKHNAN